MAWRIEVSATAAKALARLDKPTARRVRDFLRHKLAELEDPRSVGKALVGPLNLWRYRVGDYRIIVSIEDTALRILVVRIGHRREVLSRAIREFRTSLFFQQLQESYASASASDRAEDQEDQEDWDATLADGLEE